jgi:hypothetical protein
VVKSQISDLKSQIPNRPPRHSPTLILAEPIGQGSPRYNPAIMKTLLRALVRFVVSIIVLVIVIAAVGAVAYLAWLPGFLEGQIDRYLGDHQLGDARYTLESISPTGAVLTDVDLGEGLTFDRLDLAYHPKSLLIDRGIESLTLTGLRWTVDLTDNQIDLGPVTKLISKSADGPAGKLPINDLRFVDCVLTVTQGEREWPIPLIEGGWLVYDNARRALVIDITVQPGEQTHMLPVLFNAFTGYTLDGRINIAGTVSVDGQRPAITATVRDAVLRNADGSQRFAGITGQLTLDGFDPLTTPDGQGLAWTSGQFGQLRIGDGSVQCHLGAGPTLHVERLQWKIGPGRYWAHAFDVRPDQPDMKINLFWENVDLNDWLALVAADKAKGTGRLFGRLPIRVQTQPQLRLTFGEGYLISSGPGGVTIEDEQLVGEMVSTYAGQIGGEGEVGAMVQGRVVQALQDFQYQELSFVVQLEEGEPVLRVKTHGQGRVVPQELHLEVNFRGVGPLVDLLMRTQLGMDRAKDKMLRKSFGIE